MAFRTVMWNENAGPAYNAGEYRHLLYALCEGVGGVSRYGDLEVVQRGAGANMSVDVAAGRAYVLGTENAMQGAYFVTNEAAVNLAIGTANGSNPRNDLIVVRVQDSEYSGAVDTAAAVVVPGTPAASPVDPAVPANSLRLARVRVNAGATSITSANITNLRTLAPPAMNGRGRLTNIEFNQDTGGPTNPFANVVALNGSAAGISLETAGRRIKVEVTLVFRSNALAEAVEFRIRQDGVNHPTAFITPPIVTTEQDMTLFYTADFSPAAGAHIYDVTGVRISTASGLPRVQGVGSFIRIYDVGGRI